MPTVAELNVRRPTYAPERWSLYRVLAEGGAAAEAAARALIPQRPNEHPSWYASRIDRFSYKNTAGSTLNDYVSAVFQEPLAAMLAKPGKESERPETPEFYTDDFFPLPSPSDEEERSFSELLQHMLTEGMTHNEAWVMATLPDSARAVYETLEAQERAGANRVTLRLLKPESVLNASRDERGLAFVMLFARTPLPLGADEKALDELTWTEVSRRTVTTWSLRVPRGTEPSGKDVATLVDQFEHRWASADVCPVACLVMPKSLWMMDQMQLLVRSETRKRNELDWYEALVCGPQLVHKGNEPLQGTPDPAGTPRQQKRGSQYVWEIGPEDDLEWLEVSGASLTHLQGRLSDMENDVHKVTAQMAMANATGQEKADLARSGVSKQRDALTKNILCSNYARRIKTFAKKVLYLVSLGRGDADLDWEIGGLGSFDVIDLEGASSAVATAEMQPIKSETARRQIQKRFVRSALPGEDLTTLEKIDEELDSADFSEPDPLLGLTAGVPSKAPAKNTPPPEKSGPAKE